MPVQLGHPQLFEIVGSIKWSFSWEAGGSKSEIWSGNPWECD